MIQQPGRKHPSVAVSPQARIAALVAILIAGLQFCSPSAETNKLSKADLEGRAIALDLCERRPAHSFTNSGAFQFRNAKGKWSEVRATFSTTLTDSGWENEYVTTATNLQDSAHAARLVVVHRDNQPVEYRLYPQPGQSGQSGEFQTLTANAAMIPFAGSDFWLADLGLEFLHWPEQKLLKKEMHSSESCYVLESTNPNPAPGVYRRVKAWIHIESGGIVEAEAYGFDGKKVLKNFLPKSFKKVAGKYELKSVKMVNEQLDTQTLIEFDLEIK